MHADRGCPFYATSPTYEPDVIREDSPIMVMGQGPVEKDGLDPFLKIAGLTREDVSYSRAIRCLWKGGHDLPPITQTVTREALAHCTRAHLRVPSGVRLWVALGDYGAQVLTGDSIGDWRGYLRPASGRALPGTIRLDGVEEPWVPHAQDHKVLVSVWPPDLHKQPSLTMAARADWSKVARIMAGRWPRQPPRFLSDPPRQWPETFAFDTEYYYTDGSPLTTLIRYSLAWGTEDDQCTVVERGDHRLPVFVGTPRVVSQYAPADMRHLDRLSGGRGDGLSTSFWNSFLIEDAVWKHAVLWSDQDHDLNYLGSIYSSFNRWKHLGNESPKLYSALDAIGLLEIDQALQRELEADLQSRKIWEFIDRPALGEFVRAQYRGLQCDPARIEHVIGQLESVATKAARRAVASVGWPINVGSDKQTAHQLYTVEGLKVPR